jgi:hypothetical protein
MQLVLFSAFPQLTERVLEGSDQVLAQIGEQFGFDTRRDLQGIRKQLLTRGRQTRVQDTPMRRARFALHQSLAFERRDDLDDRLRAHADLARELGRRHLGPVAQAKHQQELRWGEIELGERDLAAAAHRELGAFQQIERADWRFVHETLAGGIFGGTI